MNKEQESKLHEIFKEYESSEVCMAEMLAFIPADGLSIEDAFEIYVKAMRTVENDRFFQCRDGELTELK